MTHRQSNRIARPAPARIVAALAGLVLPASALLAACSAQEGPPVDASGEIGGNFDIPAEAGTAVVRAGEDRDCLVVVWEQQAAPDREFDRANDLAEGGLISCATGTSASQYEATLSALRDAAARDSREELLGALDVPLLYIDAEGNRRDLRETDFASRDFAEVFSPEMLALMRGLDLGDMTVVPDQGGFFQLGALWLRPGEPGGRPRIVTINRQALSEAARASIEQAETSS
ncbi:hypothetical protein [Aurantiacibacter zhengii]|uniref:hypothetical protein n=1 Tax=Aurantiacibacter zhengii TaxID=2307003 RepID=UPI001F220ED8|nr:hypothetical protein [Aurantiacibacter zhengii]